MTATGFASSAQAIGSLHVAGCRGSDYGWERSVAIELYFDMRGESVVDLCSPSRLNVTEGVLSTQVFPPDPSGDVGGPTECQGIRARPPLPTLE